MIRHLYPPLRWTAQGWHCDHCGTNGTGDHVPGGEECRLVIEERVAKMIEDSGW